MSDRERDRLRLIHEVEQGHISARDAAEALGISARQFKRIRKRHREEGDKGLAHRLRGRPSNRRMPDAERQRVVEIIREKYPDFGPTLASEKLLVRDGIKLSDESVRKLMIAGGVWKPRKRKERHRQRRERRKCFGELIQIDGSLHDWLEGRGPKMVLMAMIDDATSTVVARFFPAEATMGAMLTLRQWLETYGRPREVYTDRHSIWVSKEGEPGEKDDCDGTQMRRVLRELGIGFIPARSPQAKGRVERLFGTFQDRLVKELRLMRIDNIDDANRFLSEIYLQQHNDSFTVEPMRKADAHRRVGSGFDLDLILSEREERVVQNDYTVRWRNRFFQIEKPAYPGLRGGRVEVAVKLDGGMELLFRGRRLKWHELDSAIYKSIGRHTTPRGGIREDTEILPLPAKKWVPPKDHPWRQNKNRFA